MISACHREYFHRANIVYFAALEKHERPPCMYSTANKAFLSVILFGVAIARRLAIAKSREKCYCQTSGNSTKSGKMLLPDVW